MRHSLEWRTFHFLCAIVAAYFPAMNCQTDTECNDNDLSTVDTCNTANKACVFTPGAPINSPIRSPITAPSIRAPTRAVTRSPTKVPAQTLPTRAPITVVDGPIETQERKGFFSMILNFLGDLLSRLLGGR